MAETLDSVAKALDVLRLLEDGETYGLAEVAKRLGISSSRAHRLLATLEESSFIRRSADRKYRLTFGGGTAPITGVEISSVIEFAFPIMARVRDESGETVHLCLLGGRSIYYLALAESPHMMRTTSHVGKRLPAYSTAVGKCLLAYRPEEEIIRLYGRGGLPKLTQNTIVDVKTLLEQLRECRKNGYGRQHSEVEEGIAALAVPLFFGSELPVFSLSVSGPTSRFNPRQRKSLTPVEQKHLALLHKAAGQISAAV
ncbi:IclR family transcriptional regulator [Tessaracoccus sp. MC1865]|uniref:IclR family transcriptional regulator n=1 Tax=Tessaracoccus sp. MC1865 TaxID=2760310 RepID=UPI00160375A5|nr:IclR family transcriptional regulator [Tessaracoccus sp. MC1865]MBB1482615.1 IclR family transcriptional regulator [Tessaracoccus sp. MC1865]QTO37934.1 IclR family transcriptional regulator [Tessaracoccus sp. MC1865]